MQLTFTFYYIKAQEALLDLSQILSQKQKIKKESDRENIHGVAWEVTYSGLWKKCLISFEISEMGLEISSVFFLLLTSPFPKI